MPYVDTAGVHTHFEEQGAGEGVVLLHGGLVGGAWWAPYAGPLAARYRVLTPDRRGHGRTPDVDGPYTYEAMAAETVGFLDRIVGAPAHLVGYSDGGIVGLLVAIERPDLVRSLVVIGTNFHVDGLVPEFQQMMGSPDPDEPGLAPMREAYAATSPDGAEHFGTFLRKVFEMGASGPTMTVDELSRIACPTLVIAGDDDVVRLDHVLTLYQSIGDAQLAVVPAASHALPEERPDLLARLIDRFLADPTPRTMLPIRRAAAAQSGGQAS